MSRQQDYIRDVRRATVNLWESINFLLSAQAEWNALDYTNTLADGEGDNTGYTKAEVSAVVFTTANAIETLLDQVPALHLRAQEEKLSIT